MDSYMDVLNAYRSQFFTARAAEGVIPGDRRLPEELLFTQSNARILLGQTPFGVLRFVSLPTVVYPVPVGHSDRSHGIDYYPGTYYQCDQVLMMGNMRFTAEEDGVALKLPGEADEDLTSYCGHAVPVTCAERYGMQMYVSAVAPFGRDAPMNSPAGAIFALCVRNNTEKVRRLAVTLSVDPVVMDTYRCTDYPLPRDVGTPRRYLRQETLILEKPEGYVGIHLQDGFWNLEGEKPRCVCELLVPPHGEAVAWAQIGLAMHYHDLMPVIFRLNSHSPMEMISSALDFWEKRIGRPRFGYEGFDAVPAGKTRDLYIRCMIDNFNCLQMDENNALLAHWQGAPAHNCGTIWGIDIEPTALSVMQVCPEMARKVLEFFVDRSHCPTESWPEHSMPILIAPVIVAGEYYRFTGDLKYFADNAAMMDSLERLVGEMISLKAPNADLFPSRFSSDAHVFRRYDFGTNAKCYHALMAYAKLIRDLGRTEEADRLTALAKGVQEAVRAHMICDGPFGKQFLGGTNLGEGSYDGFYLEDGAPYYDGEDSQSAMAPVCGFVGYDDEAWVNYHRFARSLWCPNFDPEYGAVRWFHDGGPLDGTAYVSRVAGCVERAEMAESLENLFDMACDETGSIFWWPLGVNWRRGNTVCSQGQGAWAQQFLRQWAGIEIDAPNRTIHFALRGLLTDVEWTDCALGGSVFDIALEENGDRTTLRIGNKSDGSWKVFLGARSPGAGATERLNWVSAELGAFGCARLEAFAPGDARRVVSVERTECDRLSDGNGWIFDTFEVRTIEESEQTGASAEADGTKWIQLRYVVESGSGEPFHDVSVEVVVPDGWRIRPRKIRHLDAPIEDAPNCGRQELGTVEPLQRRVAAFWICPDVPVCGAPRYDHHSFAEEKSTTLQLGGVEGYVTAILRAGAAEIARKTLRVGGK